MQGQQRKLVAPMKAIRLHCLECCGGQRAEVRECVSQQCALHPYRFGSSPARYVRSTNTPPERFFAPELSEKIAAKVKRLEARGDNETDKT